MEELRFSKRQLDPINRIVDGVDQGAEVIRRKARSLSREAERAVEKIQNISNESQSLVTQFQTILLDEPIELAPKNVKELKIIYMRIFYSILSMLFGQKISAYVIFKIFNQLIDTESSILLSYIIIPVIIILKYFPTKDKNEEKEKLEERNLYIYSIFIGMALGFVFIRLQTDTTISYGILNASVLFSYFNLPNFVLSVGDKRKNQVIVSVLPSLAMIFIGYILKESLVTAFLASLFYCCINFISFQVYTNYTTCNVKSTPTALIIINIILEIYLKTVLASIN
uniref:Vesicle transport protein n=1 Tax=Strongyloides papillosus TaxID=174720 RepID=A0A0N5CF50_STREA